MNELTNGVIYDKIIFSLGILFLFSLTPVFADWCSGCEYAPSIRVTDVRDHTIERVSVGQEFFISLDFTHGIEEMRDFLYILQIKNQHDETISILSENVSSGGQSVTLPIPIILYSHEKYTIEAYVWESFDRAIPIYPKSSKSFDLRLNHESCSGTAKCITGTVTSIIDGDTIKVDSQSIRFALASAPELDEKNGPESKNLISDICPVGTIVTVDEDDLQTEGSYGRTIAVIYCNGLNLNSELLDSGLGYLSTGFCNKSEFADDPWVQRHGC